METETLWLCLGFLGQGLFSLRFLIQWWKSERKKQSIIPVEFWYFSLAGGLVLSTYAIHRADPVFIMGQLAGLFVYARNLHLIQADSRRRESDLTEIPESQRNVA